MHRQSTDRTVSYGENSHDSPSKHAGRGRPLLISSWATGLRDCVSSTLYDLQVHIDA